jgi:antitoxin PrlF
MSDKTTTVTSKGQVTIPAEIREYMDIKSGDRLMFVRDAERVYIERLPRKSTSDEVYGILRRPEQPTLDVERARIEARARRSSRQKVGKGNEK